MPRRHGSFSPGGYYHTSNRVAAGRLVFVSERNYLHFLRLLKDHTRRCQVTVVAYCLMPTHFHLLLRQGGDTPVSRALSTLLNAYVQALNKEQGWRGPLFEGRCRHRAVEDYDYLRQLCGYIHLNPVASGLVTSPEAWPYSNYLEFVGARSGTLVDHALVAELWPAGGYGAVVEEYARDREQMAALQRRVWRATLPEVRKPPGG